MKFFSLCAALALALSAPPSTASAESAHTLLAEAVGKINPRYLLMADQGQAVTQEDFRGRFQLLSFGYTLLNADLISAAHFVGFDPAGKNLHAVDLGLDQVLIRASPETALLRDIRVDGG